MNPEVKSKWIAALRSGDYAQGSGALRKDDTFCCLGVLCDVISPDEWMTDVDDPARPYLYRGIRAKYMLPWDMQHKYGIDRADHDSLVDMNDAGKSFAEIADYIERTL